MTDKTDALLALADEMDRHVLRLPDYAAKMLKHYSTKLRAALAAPAEGGQDWRIGMFDRWNARAKELGFNGIAEAIDCTSALAALAAPAEGGQGEVVVNLATLQRWRGALDGYHPSDVPDTVTAREEMAALIDSAGEAKCTGADCKPRDGGTLCQSCGGDITPQPVEGDCPRCGCVDDGECLCPTQPAEGDGTVEMHVRHEGSGLLALYNGDKQIREIGITPGWHFKDRDEFIFRYNNYTRPATTAVVPDGWKLVPIVATPSMDAAGKKALSDNGVTDVHDADALVCFAAMLAAAPAAPAVVPGYAVELLTNIKRACVRGRNVANMEVEANFVATCDHIESLADQALAALATGEQL